MGEETTKRKAGAESAEGAEKRLTKRQKRKKLNEKNKWPQHPKIQNMEQRAKAYIRVAGLGSTSKAKETIDPKLDLMSSEVKFGRLLGATDQRKRHAAVNKLKAYLKARCDISNENGGLSELDLLKLWKGLWYTLYMTDKVPVQDELSKRLAELLWCVAGTEEEDEYAAQAYLDMCEAAERAMADGFGEDDVTMEEIENTLRREVGGDDEDSSDSENAQQRDEDGSDGPEETEEKEEQQQQEDEEEIDTSEISHCRGAHLASIFIRTFFRTIKREWGNMDKYRVDKFYSLTRMCLHEVFKYMATRHWNIGIIRLFNDALFEEVLNQTPNGLRYHLIDITLEELAKVNAKAPMPLTEATFLDALEPYFAMCQSGAGGDATIQTRVLEKVVEKFLDEYSVVSDKALADDDAEEKILFDQVHVGSVSQFIFELASDPETNDRYRKSLYDMHKKYMRRLKKVGVDVDLDEADADAEENVADYDSEDAEENKLQEGEGDEDPTEEDLMEEAEIERKAAERLSKRTKKKDKHVKVEDAKERENSKKKKKKKKNEGKVESPEATPEEETMMISISEQKQAKAEGKKKKKKRKSKEEGKLKAEELDSKSEESGDRRVKWNKSNRSKSFKASMKALVTATPPKTSIKTPEKSILLNKTKSRKNRKKALEYF